MCRLIMALGEFSVDKVIASAVAMSEGKTADADAPIKAHLNGWGAVWQDKKSPLGLAVYRHDGPIVASHAKEVLQDIETQFLAVHVRHATISENIGINFVHPIDSLSCSTPWFMMHNGYLPTVYEKLGKHESEFDTQEYHDYILPKNTDFLNRIEVIKKLNALRSGGTSANAIIVNSRKIYVIHWSMPNVPCVKYYTLHNAADEHAYYLASEIQTNILPKKEWMPLIPSTVYEYPLQTETYRSMNEYVSN